MTKPADGARTFSIADIEAQVMVEETFPFEPLLPNLEPSGIIFQLKSDLAPSVEGKIKQLLDGHTRKDQLKAAQAARSRPGEVINTVDEQAVLGRKLVAARIDGWSMADEFNETNVQRVLKAWVGLSEQILAKSAELARFTMTSPKA